MKLSHEDLKVLCLIAKEAAVKAGTMIESYLSVDPERQQLQISHKTAGSSKASQVVTEVDFKCEKIILDLLNPTLAKFDLALLSEESTDDLSRFKKDYFWCIDPLDGTLPFIEFRPGFSVSIALVSKEGKSQIGVVYDPLTKTLYSAVKGQGVFKNDKEWKKITDKEALDIDSPNKHSETSKILTIITEPGLIKRKELKIIKDRLNLFTKTQGWNGIKLLEGGGAVFNACQVIEKPPAVYFKLPKPTEGGGSLWDFAATCAIFEELDVSVSDVFGKALLLNNEGSTFMNHYGVIYASQQKILIEVVKICAQLFLTK